jgi:hypothetical protein
MMTKKPTAGMMCERCSRARTSVTSAAIRSRLVAAEIVALTLDYAYQRAVPGIAEAGDETTAHRHAEDDNARQRRFRLQPHATGVQDPYGLTLFPT